MIFSFFRKRSVKLPKAYKDLIDPDAIDIVKSLQRSGFEAYLVGGCVRDILLDRKCKDFDISTSATPEQVKACVSRSQVIGKRFRIVLARRRLPLPKNSHRESFPEFFDRPPLAEHQITTFRREPEWDPSKERLNENVYGSAKEDALRRDFTINALMLDPTNSKIVDYVNGSKDIENRVLRVIGDPKERFEEDPIRLLRAIRFSKRAGVTYEQKTEKALLASLKFLKDAKKERVREEILKIWREGHADEVFQHMSNLDVWSKLSPLYDHRLKNNTQSYQQLISICKAVNKTPWQHSRNHAPFFFLMAHDLFLGGTRKDKSKVDELFASLNVSKKEFEDIKRSQELLQKIEKEPKAHKLRSMRIDIRSYDSLSQAFYIMRTLAAARISPYPALWKQWDSVWEEYKNSCLQGLKRRPRPARGRSRSRRPRRSASSTKTTKKKT